MLEETLELNCPIMDWGAGGGWAAIMLGRGNVREVTDSISDPAVE